MSSLSSPAAPSIGAIQAVALQVAGPQRPTQQRPVELNDAFLIAPDGSTNAPAAMLHAFCQRVLPWATFALGDSYIVTLSVEGGLYRLDAAIFPGRFEVFGIVFLFDGAATASNQDARIASLQTDREALSSDDGLVVTMRLQDSEGQP